jgi:hypothetical protein
MPPMLNVVWSYPSAIAFFVLNTVAVAPRDYARADLHGRGVSGAGVGCSASATAYNMAWGADC